MDIKTNQTKPVTRLHKGGAIDGFSRVSRGTALQPLRPVAKPRTSAQADTPALHPAYAPGTHSSPAKAARPAHAPAHSVKPHAPQKATTLMRSAVKKPVIQSAAVIKAQSRTDLLASVPVQTVAPKMSFNAINLVRHRRAERMVKSPAVSRYAAAPAVAPSLAAASMPTKVSSTVQASSYALTPTHHAVPPKPLSQPTAGRPGTTRQALPSSLPGRSGMIDLRSAAGVRPAAQSGRQATAVSRPAATPATHKHDIFDEAIARSISHEQTYDQQPTRAKKRSRLFRFAAGTAAVIAVVGALGYYNAPSLSLKVASYRSGLHATLPAQQPAGFNLGYLDYQPGNITANFTSPQDGRQYNITQKASSWDSEALLSNFVASANSAYKTYQRAGRTVYVLGNNTATWVDSGIWYTVDGNASLTSQQLLELAGSM